MPPRYWNVLGLRLQKKTELNGYGIGSLASPAAAGIPETIATPGL
jgi:hypothetical protein